MKRQAVLENGNLNPFDVALEICKLYSLTSGSLLKTEAPEAVL